MSNIKLNAVEINNRMYCEYFKLYKIITEYILKNITDKKSPLDSLSVLSSALF